MFTTIATDLRTPKSKQDAQLLQRDRAAGCVIGEKRKIRAIAQFQVIEVGTNRKPVCDFLLVN